MRNLNFLIDDENRYYAAGLQYSIIEYAQVNQKKVSFLKPEEAERADVVIVTSGRRAQRWRRVGQPVAAQVVTIKERKFTASDEASYVLYRAGRQNELFRLLSCLFSSEGIRSNVATLTLTDRERQVVGHLRRGVGQAQVARMMGVSVKTVHSHKRSVMDKLLLTRQHDFIYWLLSHDGEYS